MRAAGAPSGVMTLRRKTGRKPRAPADLSIFPRFFLTKSRQYVGAQPSELLPGVLGLADNSKDPEGQTIPSVSD